jgi:transcriptional regulator with XRE-family HTH domain
VKDTILVLLVTLPEAQRRLADAVREHRLSRHLTQAALAGRSGVPIATLRKFEQRGLVSLQSFLKLLLVLDLAEPVLAAITSRPSFTSIDEVLAVPPVRKRGRRP